MYKIKAADPAGRLMTFACGTSEQALQKAQELTWRGFRDIVVIDPSGKGTGAKEFARLADVD